jgi:hypothetical protein
MVAFALTLSSLSLAQLIQGADAAAVQSCLELLQFAHACLPQCVPQSMGIPFPFVDTTQAWSSLLRDIVLNIIIREPSLPQGPLPCCVLAQSISVAGARLENVRRHRQAFAAVGGEMDPAVVGPVIVERIWPACAACLQSSGDTDGNAELDPNLGRLYRALLVLQKDVPMPVNVQVAFAPPLSQWLKQQAHSLPSRLMDVWDDPLMQGG